MLNAIDLFRIGHKAYNKKIPIIPKVMFHLNYALFRCVIPSECSIGEGSRFAYGGICVVLNKNAQLGNNCMIGQGVTIGGKPGQNGGVPVIGNNCYLAAGCKVLGGVTVGDNCVIGANAVVTHDIPDNCVVAGVPARVIKTDIDINDYWKS